MAVRTSTRLRRMVVAVDGSNGAETALRAAIHLAQPLRAHLDLVSVVPTLAEFSRHARESSALLDLLRRDAEAYVAEARTSVAGARLEGDATVLEGHPAEEICRFVERTGPDLTVLGSRGLSEQKIHLVGSVGYTVAHFAKSPVLLVRDADPVRRILVAVDGSAPAVRAAEWAAGLSQSLRASLTLLYVIPQETEEVKFTVSRGVGEPFLGPLAKATAERGVAVERKVEYGRPAETIVRVAAGGFDLVILGHQGRGAAAGFTLGGVTDKVLHHAPTSTLVVR